MVLPACSSATNFVGSMPRTSAATATRELAGSDATPLRCVAYYKLLYHWQFFVEADIIRVQNVVWQAGSGYITKGHEL